MCLCDCDSRNVLENQTHFPQNDFKILGNNTLVSFRKGKGNLSERIEEKKGARRKKQEKEEKKKKKKKK
jgi:2-methylcitrate dehydratase PrpD